VIQPIARLFVWGWVTEPWASQDISNRSALARWLPSPGMGSTTIVRQGLGTLLFRHLFLLRPQHLPGRRPVRPLALVNVGTGAGMEKNRACPGRRRGRIGLIKVRSTQAHGSSLCPELAQLRPQIVPWSTLCRADWVHNDPVLTTRGWLLRHYDPVSPGGHAAASEHQGE
jgi:hypothetical protein